MSAVKLDEDCHGCDLKPPTQPDHSEPWECGTCGRLYQTTWAASGIAWWTEVRGPAVDREEQWAIPPEQKHGREASAIALLEVIDVVRGER